MKRKRKKGRSRKGKSGRSRTKQDKASDYGGSE